MTETDLDNELNLADNEVEVRLPWESIDPPPVQRINRSVFRANAVKTAADFAVADLSAGLHAFGRIHADSPADVVTDASPDAPDAEERLETNAFLSDEIVGDNNVSANNSVSRAPALGGAGRGEGPVVENSATSQSFVTPAAPKVAHANFFDEPEQDITVLDVFQDETTASAEAESSEAASLPIDATPWAGFDEVLPDPVESAAAIPTHDSLLTAASELATLAESFGEIDIEESAEPTVVVSAHVGDTDGVFVVPAPAASVQTETAVETEIALEPELSAPTATTGGGWTIPLMCLGLGLIACCMVIPQGESNRQLRYEHDQLQANLQNVDKQVAVNSSFLKSVMDDPTLAERLASRQMKTIRKGQTVVLLKKISGENGNEMSPFALVAVAPPPAMPEYHPRRGTIADLCNDSRSRLYLLGSALAMVATGLVMGFNSEKSRPITDDATVETR